MSKKSKSQRVIYDPSASINLNGQDKVSASSTKNGVKVSYNMNPYEQAAYEFSMQDFYENLPNVNVFSDDTIKTLNKEVEAFLGRGINTINTTYTPMIREMQNDVARRFGNIDNSVFIDNLKDIEAQRAGAISDLANSVEEKRSELVGNELKSRYDYLNFLNNYQNQVISNMLSMLGVTNDFLQTNNSHLNGTNTTSSSKSNTNLGDIAKIVAQVFSTFAN